MSGNRWWVRYRNRRAIWLEKNCSFPSENPQKNSREFSAKRVSLAPDRTSDWVAPESSKTRDLYEGAIERRPDKTYDRGALSSGVKRACHLAVFSGKLLSMEAEIDDELPSNSN